MRFGCYAYFVPNKEYSPRICDLFTKIENHKLIHPSIFIYLQPLHIFCKLVHTDIRVKKMETPDFVFVVIHKDFCCDCLILDFKQEVLFPLPLSNEVRSFWFNEHLQLLMAHLVLLI